MAKNILFKQNSSEHWIRRNNLDDILNLSRFNSSKIESFSALFGTRTEREGKNIAKRLLCRMNELMAQDLIGNNDIFVLPRQGVGYLKISDLSTFTGERKHQPDPSTGEKVYGGIVMLDALFRRASGGKNYFFKLTRPWMIKLFEAKSNGKVWL